MRVEQVSAEVYENTLQACGCSVPIEQLCAWQNFQAAIDGRSLWGYCLFYDEGDSCDADAGDAGADKVDSHDADSHDNSASPIASIALAQYETHGYRYLRSAHGPLCFVERSPELERQLTQALIAFVRQNDKRQVFMRIALEHESEFTCDVLSTLPYDTTVVIDLTGGQEDILSRMKPRGRRDVRKSLRECPAHFADETQQAADSFDEYLEVMQQTASRDGFVAGTAKLYQDMLRILGSKHCRLYAARHEGKLLAWSMLTFSYGWATRYYAATSSQAGKMRVADALVLFECEQAQEMGCTSYDLMGIGSERYPETLNLNEFKTKFAKDGIRSVAPDRDVPLHTSFYKLLQALRRLRGIICSR